LTLLSLKNDERNLCLMQDVSNDEAGRPGANDAIAAGLIPHSHPLINSNLLSDSTPSITHWSMRYL